MTFYFGLTTRSSAGITIGETACGTPTTTTLPLSGDSNDTDRFLTYLPFMMTVIFCIIVSLSFAELRYYLTAP